MYTRQSQFPTSYSESVLCRSQGTYIKTVSPIPMREPKTSPIAKLP